MAIPQGILDEIQDRTDIVSLISSYIPLKKSGRNFRTICPFHSEKTASFFVSPNKQIFHCFGCGAGGGSIQFVMQYEKVPFPEAAQILAKRLGISLPSRNLPEDSFKSKAYTVNKEACLYFHKNLFSSSGASALKYLKERGISEQVIKDFKIGYALAGFRDLLGYMRSKSVTLSMLDKLGLISETRDGNFIDLFRNRIIFPILDVKSRVIGFGARRLVEDKNVPKYINTPESILYHKGMTLFGINMAKSAILDKDFCLIVEGYLDMIIPFQAGFTNILASSGTALTVEQIRMIKRFTKNIVLVFDSDSAGKDSSLRAIDSLIEQDLNIKAVSLPQGLDPDTLVRKKGKLAFQELIDGSEDFFFYKLNILLEKFNINDIKEKSDLLLDMLLSLTKFNNHLVRYEYLKKLAESLKTKEEFLLLELKKLEQKKSGRVSLEQDSFSEKDDASEEYLTKCMLSDSKVIKIVSEVIAPEEITSPGLRMVVEECFKHWKAEGDFQAKKILAQLNGKVANKISQLIFEDFKISEQALKESILKIKKRSLRLKKDKLKERIKEAEESKNDKILTELISEYEKMIKQEKA